MKKDNVNLQSSVNKMGEVVIQEIHGVGGIVCTIEGVYTSKIQQGVTTTLVADKATHEINTKNVNYIKVKGSSGHIPPGDNRTSIFHFMCGEKLSITDIIVGSEVEGEFMKFWTSSGWMYLIQRANLFREEKING